MTEHKPTCGRCGVYKHLHPVKWCKGYRHSWWWDRHSLAKHVAVWVWIRLMRSSWRMGICAYLSSAAGQGWRDWCQLFDCAHKADHWEDEPGYIGYRHDYEGKWGCLCDFPMPWEVKAATPGSCYCCVPPLPVPERAA